MLNSPEESYMCETQTEGEKMKKVLCLLMAVIMIVGLCACGGSNNSGNNDTKPAESGNAQEETTKGKMGDDSDTKAAEDRISEVNYTEDGRTLIRIATSADIANESVWLSNDGTGRKYIIYSVFEPLFQMDGTGGDLVPCLGKSFERVDDYTYKIELYDNIFDTAGNHLTASDVLWSFDTAKEPKKRNLKCIESFTADDDFHLTLKLNSNDVGLFERAMFQTHVVTQKAYEDSGDEMKTQAVATGPYMITEWVEGSKIVLEKNPDYWAKDIDRQNYQWQNVDVIEFDIIPEAVQQLTGLDTGKIDIIPSTTYDKAAPYMPGGDKSEGYVVYDKFEATQFMQFNCNEASPCKDINLRKAIAYAIDAEGLLDGVMDGAGEVAHGFNSALGDYVEAWDDLDYFDYNVDTAKDFLSQSGYNNEKLVILTDTSDMGTDTGLMILNYLQDIGVNAELLSVESSIKKETAADYTAWDLQIGTSGAADYHTVNWRANWDPAATGDGLLPCGILDPKLDELLATVRNVNTWNDESVDAFMKYYQMEQLYEISLFTPYFYCISRDWMTSYAAEASGWFMPGSCTYTWNE